MPIYSKSFTFASNTANLVVNIDNAYCCNEDEKYKTSVKALGTYKAITEYGYNMIEQLTGGQVNTSASEWNGRVAISLEDTALSGQLSIYGNPNNSPDAIGTFNAVYGQELYEFPTPTEHSTSANYVAGVLSPQDNRVVNVIEWDIATNIPIFETNTARNNYIRNGVGISSAINYYEPQLPPERKKKFIYNAFRHGTPTANGVEFDGTETKVFERFEVSNDAVLYPDGDGYRIKLDGELISCEMSTFDEFNNFTQYDFLVYSGLFYKAWDGITLQAGIYATRDIDTNMLIMDSEANAEAYINATTEEAKEIIASTHATNYIDIQNGNYYRPFNPTGESEEETTFGEVYHEPAFQRAYVLGRGALAEIKSALFDTTAGGIFEDIAKGLALYGENPAESIIDLSYYPFNIDDVITVGQAQNYVFFGGYQLQLQNNTVKQVIFPNGYIDLGTFVFRPSFNSWKDFTSKAYFYCPYIGVYELDITRYIGKTITTRFYVDFDTRACMCVLIGDGLMLDYFTGEIGVGQPMRATDFSAYANTQLQTILSGATNSVNMASGGVGTGASIGAMVGAGALTGGVAGAGIGLALGVGATVFNASQQNINRFNKTKGSSTGTLNEFLPQYPYFIFELDNTEEPDNLKALYGYPSDTGGQVQMFNGFLQCSKVNLVCENATENEKKEIESMLLSGVYL